MDRTTPPFRADHVGSLLRPRRLLQTRDDHAAGRIPDQELRAVEDDAIREGDAYAEQVRRVGELGCTYLQFDDSSSGWAPLAEAACNLCYN